MVSHADHILKLLQAETDRAMKDNPTSYLSALKTCQIITHNFMIAHGFACPSDFNEQINKNAPIKYTYRHFPSFEFVLSFKTTEVDNDCYTTVILFKRKLTDHSNYNSQTCTFSSSQFPDIIPETASYDLYSIERILCDLTISLSEIWTVREDEDEYGDEYEDEDEDLED